jgi:hypothetical protein
MIGGIMLTEAVTFAVASVLHFGIVIPLGIVTIHGESFIGAAIPEAIIAVVLAGGSIGVMMRVRSGWGLAMTTTLSALAGVIIGLSVILGGRVSRPADLSYHASIFVALVITVGLLLTPAVRRALRRPTSI